jgi:hypothetical protein
LLLLGAVQGHGVAGSTPAAAAHCHHPPADITACNCLLSSSQSAAARQQHLLPHSLLLLLLFLQPNMWVQRMPLSEQHHLPLQDSCRNCLHSLLILPVHPDGLASFTESNVLRALETE